MPEDASRFISSLIKSLQIICNGNVDFKETIELVGHINLRIDHKFKYNYIVDEHVSKEGEDCSTTFLSNSYHSCPPSRETELKDSSPTVHELSLPNLQTSRFKPHELQPSEKLTLGKNTEDVSCSFDVNIESSKDHGIHRNKMVFKLEGEDESNECMIMPSTAGDFELSNDANVSEIIASASSGSTDDVHSKTRGLKRLKTSEQGPGGSTESKVTVPMVMFGTTTTVPKSEKSPDMLLPSAFSCPSCDFVSHSDHNYRLHTQKCHHFSTKHPCSFCPFQGDSQNALLYHLYTEHKCTETLSPDGKRISCSLCAAHFKSQTGLRQHMEVKHGTSPSLRCPICGKIMYNKTNLEGHMNKHKGIKPFSCPLCKKSFVYKQSLHAHEKLCFLHTCS